MLFNSYAFILDFLPVALIIFALLSKSNSPIFQMIWLSVWSLIFYASWKPKYLIILMISVLVNYFIAILLMNKKRKFLFILGILFNIGVITIFKYTDFLIENFNTLTSSQIAYYHFALPLGISFITFQKIGYLVDVYRGHVKEKNFLRFLVFISFFPQLIAGPIVHYNPLMSQFSKEKSKKMRYPYLAKGMTLFVIGLAKKVLLADTLASYSDNAFSAAMASVNLSFIESWIGILSYTFQMYFDFSGYSDMAIGLALMFGIRLPINFNSPYKAENIIELWRRWHITLSTFLRDYIYLTLGGSRKGQIRKFVNLMVTMLIAGLWHGANWNYVLWGGIQGILLTINHIWRGICELTGLAFLRGKLFYRFISQVLTFVSFVFALMVFRTPNLYGFKYIFNGVLGKNGFHIPETSYLNHMHNRFDEIFIGSTILGHKIMSFNPVLMPIFLLLFVMSIIFLLPNSQQLIRLKITSRRPSLFSIFEWKPQPFYLLGTLVLFYTCFLFMTDLNIRPFAYFAF